MLVLRNSRKHTFKFAVASRCRRRNDHPHIASASAGDVEKRRATTRKRNRHTFSQLFFFALASPLFVSDAFTLSLFAHLRFI